MHNIFLIHVYLMTWTKGVRARCRHLHNFSFDGLVLLIMMCTWRWILCHVSLLFVCFLWESVRCLLYVTLNEQGHAVWMYSDLPQWISLSQSSLGDASSRRSRSIIKEVAVCGRRTVAPDSSICLFSSFPPPLSLSLSLESRREAGDVWCQPPVWNLRAVIWFPFPISSLVCFLPSPLALSVLSFSANGPFSWLFSPENSQIFFVKG